MSDAAPKLRGEIDAAPASRDGDAFYILYDRSGVSPSRLLLSPLGLLIAGRLDGAASVLEISDNLGRETPGGASCREIESVVRALDDALFLEGARFQDFSAQAERDFLSAPSRPPGLAGSAYSADPIRLAETLNRVMDEAPAPEEAPGRPRRPPRGMIIPHLDYPRGAPGYGQAYRLLAGAPKPPVVVVLGTAHAGLRERFALCDKDFDTPLGRVRVDRDLLARLRLAASPHGDPDREALAHRSEHSVELQAVWLRHIYGEDLAIVPLLVSPVGEFLNGGRPPAEAETEPMFRAVAECLGGAAESGEALLLASADLAHVGPRFGDRREAAGQFLTEVEEADRGYLRAAAAGAVPGLANLAAHGDRYRVCGSACIFVLGLALPGARATLLGYHQAVTPEMREAVAYAAVCFE
ncbi:MAG: AmmeMemoRadiSam system protein B [Planctomycetota bacterium]|jgi:AmmeMemoRadiSam system protein B|nr:AmmeMemoRadiSam system protein B [Planctomycetota bacterium]